MSEIDMIYTRETFMAKKRQKVTEVTWLLAHGRREQISIKI